MHKTWDDSTQLMFSANIPRKAEKKVVAPAAAAGDAGMSVVTTIVTMAAISIGA